MPLKDHHKAMLYFELAKLSGAGFAITDATAAALDTKPCGNQRRFLEELQNGIEAGKNLSTAAENTSANLTSLEISVIRAAEEGGRIAEGFTHLARYFQTREKATRKIRAKLLYPALLLHLAVILPAMPKAVISGDFQRQAILVAATLFGIYLLLAIGFITLRAAGRKASRSTTIDGILRAIPLVGRVRQQFAMARFCEVMHIHILSGSGPGKAIRAAAQASASGRIMAACNLAVLPEVENGDPAGPALIANAGRDFPPAFARSYATSEEAGCLDEEMQRWSTTFTEEAERAIERMASAIPIIVYLFVFIFVAWQIINMANMRFELIEQFQQGTL
ncbi:MAG: type II secretion system F family protein [Verrucomicrobiales bacterium]|nr:type II secretion system F family protein [Verrucomicrobiales bacterium]MED5586706.1 type II secretion system F family protein [Verrucomicrobiota bacterium]